MHTLVWGQSQLCQAFLLYVQEQPQDFSWLPLPLLLEVATTPSKPLRCEECIFRGSSLRADILMVFDFLIKYHIESERKSMIRTTRIRFLNRLLACIISKVKIPIERYTYHCLTKAKRNNNTGHTLLSKTFLWVISCFQVKFYLHLHLQFSSLSSNATALYLSTLKQL